MLDAIVLIILLFRFGNAEEMFNTFQGKSFTKTSHSFEMMKQARASRSHRHCTMRCNFEPQCLVAFFEGETSLCRLYSNINGTTTGSEEGDISMVKREIGVCESIISFIYLHLFFIY